MINRLQKLKPLICKQHNQHITQFLKDQPLCPTCLDQQPEMMSIEKYYQKLDKILLKENEENQLQHQILQQTQDCLISYKRRINKDLEVILQSLQKQISVIKTQEQYFSSLIETNNNQQKIIGEWEEELINIQQKNQSARNQIQNLLLDFKQKQVQIDFVIGLLKQRPEQKNVDLFNASSSPKKILIQEVQRDQQINSNKFEYQIIKENSMKHDNNWYAFAFNRDSNILAIGSYQVIIIYEFNKGKLSKQLQRLEEHFGYFNYLYFLKESNGLVFGSYDSLIIWSLNKNSQYVAKQTLNDPKLTANCLLKNKKEDLLISGSDETIKFWRVQNGNWNCVQTIETKGYVLDLSLNEMENKLISCNTCSQIFVYEIQQRDQQWILVQKINTSETGLRLCFTIGDQFVFQPETLDYLEIYDYDKLKKQFYKLKQVQIQSCKKCDRGFPCQFIKQLNILNVKHGNYLNIFSVSQDGNYQLIQSIEYNDYRLYGRMTDNGQYLVTWDYESNEIQVRKLTYVE